MTFLLDVLPLIAGVLLAITYVPQIIKTHKTKDVTGMSVWFWILLIFALMGLTANAITIFILYGTWGYMVTEFFNTGLAIYVLCQVLYYRKK
jgi:uncharacterized protein with PQ loop repeat